MIYKETLIVDSNDINPDLTLKIPSLFKYLQDLGMNGCELIGAGKKETLDKGLLWVYTRVYVEIYSLPTYQQEIEMITYPGKTSACFFPRYYKIMDSKGKVFIKASSMNVLIDKKTRSLVMNPPLPQIDGVHFDDELDKPGRAIIKSSNSIGTHKVQFSEIDLNGHLNNTKYIETIINLKDRSFYESHKIKSILINYDKEISEKALIELRGNVDESFEVEGLVDGTSCFKAVFDIEKV